MSYKQVIKREYRPRSGLYLGGMGTGGVELRADGLFYNWQFFNNAPFGHSAPIGFKQHSILFFKVRWQIEGHDPQLKILQIEDNMDVGSMEDGSSYYIVPWMTGVDEIEYEASFPYAKLTYKDGDMPFDIKLTASSSFIPHDEKDSSLPGMYFDFEIIPKTDQKMDVLIMMSGRNMAGYDISEKTHKADIFDDGVNVSVQMGCDFNNGKENNSSDGTILLMSCGEGSSYYAGWEHVHPYYEYLRDRKTLSNINDTPNRGGMPRCWSTVGRSFVLGDESVKHSFIAAFDFPYLYAVAEGKDTAIGTPDMASNVNEGHYHNNFFSSAKEVADYMLVNKEKLQSATSAFYKAFFDSSLHGKVLDQINSHLNTLISSTWFTKDGFFGVEEGKDYTNVGGISTIDVLNYGMVMVECLFPKLAQMILKQNREIQFPDGKISHHSPKAYTNIKGRGYDTPRRDLPIQYPVMAMRNFFWTNDKEFIEDMWPSVKLALDYAYDVNDKDGDGIPDMEGIMSSYDNFPMHGASAFIGSQWIAAMRLAVKTAQALGDTEAEKRYSGILPKALKTYEEKLWTGKYFRLYDKQADPNEDNGITERDDKGQLSGGAIGGELSYDGCLTDQMVGQWALLWTEKGWIADEAKVKQALRSILAMSYKKEKGLCNCSWPQYDFVTPIPDDIWVDQANTCWTGVELAFSSFLMYMGMYYEAVEIASNVDDRFKKSGMYWDHFECGGHYCRPLSSWGIVIAAAGYSVMCDRHSFKPNVPGERIRLYVTGSDFTGSYRHDKFENTVSFEVLSGAMKAKSISFEVAGIDFGNAKVYVDGTEASDAKVDASAGIINIEFANETVITDRVEIR